MLHGSAGDPDMTVEMVEVELRRVADLPAVVLVGVAAVQDHVAGHEGGGVEGHLGGAALSRVHHLAPAQPTQLQQVDLVAQFTVKMSLKSWDLHIGSIEEGIDWERHKIFFAVVLIGSYLLTAIMVSRYLPYLSNTVVLFFVKLVEPVYKQRGRAGGDKANSNGVDMTIRFFYRILVLWCLLYLLYSDADPGCFIPDPGSRFFSIPYPIPDPRSTKNKKRREKNKLVVLPFM
jgi:hypothetical protein